MMYFDYGYYYSDYGYAELVQHQMLVKQNIYIFSEKILIIWLLQVLFHNMNTITVLVINMIMHK
jgi:hypothetical protein